MNKNTVDNITPEIQGRIQDLKKKLYEQSYQKLCMSNDRVFAALMAFQWLASVALALTVSPKTWLGNYGQTHIHVWTAVILGGFLSAMPIYLGLKRPGAVANRYINVISQALYSALLIHLTGGRIETHFHVFGSLAFFAFYRDIRVLLAGTVVVAVDHAIRGIFYPQSAFGIFSETNWRWLEHAGWVVFEDFFLAYSIFWSQKEMRIVADKQAQVEVYNEIIEQQVRDRTQELREERNSVKLLLDNAGQGFLSFDSNGTIGKQSSSAAHTIFGMDPSGRHISTLFDQPQETWSEYVRILFEEALPLKDLLGACPKVTSANGRTVSLEYQPVRGEDKKLRQIMLVATDVTDLRALERARESEQNLNRAVIKILSAKNDFVELLEMMTNLENYKNDEKQAKHTLHTLKGGFAFLECREFATLCHEWEGRLKEGFTAERFSEAVRSLRETVDDFLDKHDKLLGLRKSSKKVIPVEAHLIETLIQDAMALKTPDPVVQGLERLTEQSVHECLGWLSDVFVSTAANLGKEVDPFEWSGSAKICPDPYKDLFKSLIHIPRNSADHGIEAPEDRIMSGKPEKGKMHVSLILDQDHYQLTFRDDGAGVDLDKIRRKARDLSLPDPANENEALELLFHNGFSTKEQLTETSGRGVGLDAVRAEARRLGGDVKAINHPGSGLEITVRFKKMSIRPLAKSARLAMERQAA